jgi:hypothetical protein
MPNNFHHLFGLFCELGISVIVAYNFRVFYIPMFSQEKGYRLALISNLIPRPRGVSPGTIAARCSSALKSSSQCLCDLPSGLLRPIVLFFADPPKAWFSSRVLQSLAAQP